MNFEAKYRGKCDACTEQIDPGDECAYAEDVVVHADCQEAAEAAERRAARAVRPICQTCFMETAANGKCGCDE